MDHWDEVRTAYYVTRAGTVSGAAESLGIHHATVIRHIDSLEGRLGVKLFQRHARGYLPTEAGADLARVAKAADEQFSQLDARLKGGGGEVTGDIVITCLPAFAERLAETLCDFQLSHPGVRVRLLTGARLFRLEYGEAHVAIRAGEARNDPDNVVQSFFDISLGLYAAPSYIARYGRPTLDTLSEHFFIGTGEAESRAPFMKWLVPRIPPEAFIFQATSDRALRAAAHSGVGLGFLQSQHSDGLIQVLPPMPEWNISLSLITHVDLHRSPKVQAIVTHLKAAAAKWIENEPDLSLP